MTFPNLPKLPSLPEPPLPDTLRQINAFESQLARLRVAQEQEDARQAGQRISQTEPTTINQDTLVPETPFEPPPPDRHGFLNRLQSFGEASAGGLAQLITGLIPGEQSFFREKELSENIKAAGDELEKPTNPWDMLRWDAMRTAEGFRRTDQASVRLNIVPGDGINLPGDRTLNEVDLGVKGAMELILDPLNLVPFTAPAKFIGKASAGALRRIGAGSLVEASIHGHAAVVNAANVARGAMHPLGNVPTPKDIIANQRGRRVHLETAPNPKSGKIEPDNDRFFTLSRDGKVFSEVEIESITDDIAQVSMFPPKGVGDEVVNSMSKSDVLDSAQQLFEKFPELKRIEGERITGASGDVLRKQGFNREQVMKGLRQPDGAFIRVDDVGKLIKDIDKALEKMPEWVRSLRDMKGGTISKFAIGPLQWGMTRMNAMTMLHSGSDISKKLRIITLAHQMQAVKAPIQTDFALLSLNNFGGYKGDIPHGLFSVKSKGVLAKLKINQPIQGVFDVSGEGIVTNLVHADGSLHKIAGDELNALHHQYNLFEGAFKPSSGYSFSNTFRYKGKQRLITDLPLEKIDQLIANGTVSPVFVNQAFAIKHVQNWFKEAANMLDEYGVPRTDIYEGDDLMQYIARTVLGKDGIPFPTDKKTTGATQSISKKRTVTHDNFAEGLNSGLEYQPNFMLSAREFSDSVYMTIRDTQLKHRAESLGHRIRDTELEPLRRQLNETKTRVGKITNALGLVRFNKRGARLTGSQSGAMTRMGDELGFDWSDTKAIDVTDRQMKAIKSALTEAKKQVKMAKHVRKVMFRNTTKDTTAIYERLGWTNRSGNIHDTSTIPFDIPEEFAENFPEFATELKKLHAIDVRVRMAPDLKKRTTRRGKDDVWRTEENNASKEWRKTREKLQKSIEEDVKLHVSRSERAELAISGAVSRGGKLAGRDSRFLQSHFPHLKKMVDQANSESVEAVKKARLGEVSDILEKELKSAKEIELKFTDDLRKKKDGLRGDVWTIEPEPFDYKLGKHPVKVISGPSYREALKKGTLIVKRKEASQQRLGFLSGLFFTEEDVKLLERALLLPDTSTAKGQTAGVFLRVAPAAGDLVRVLKAGFDFGAPFLQGIPLLATRPDIWAKSTARHIKVFAAGGQLHTSYLQQNMGALREMVQMGVPFGGAASDYFVAVQRGGVLPSTGKVIGDITGINNSNRAGARAVRSGARSFEAVATRFEQSFEAFGDYARLEMWKAMRDTAFKKEDGLQELAAFIRNSTGALNSGSLGISPTQQALERGWLFFSPRYTRASLALVADAFQGGLRGTESRRTLASMAAGGAAAYAGFVGAHNLATGGNQRVKLDPRSKADGGDGAEFMTIEINGRNVGIGSFWTSFVRLLASTGSEAIDDPQTLMKPSTRDNPIVRWLRSRSAPMTGMALDLQNGSTFMGEPLDNAGDWATHLTKQTLPFVIENAIFDDGAIFGRLTTSLPAEFAGMRTFNVSVIEQRNEERDLAAKERFGKEWDELNGLQRKSLENDPNRELGRLTSLVKKEASQMSPADPESAEGIIDAYFEDKQEIEVAWREIIKQGVSLFDNQRIDAVTLKERYIEPANAERRLRIGDLSEDESYQEIEDYFARQKEDGGVIILEDYAFAEYIEQIVSADFTDPIIGFNFRARDAAERLYGDKFGQEMLAYVRDRFRAARESYDFEMPSVMDELYIGRERFQWYWRDVEAEVMKQQRNPEIVLGKYEEWLGETPTRRTELRETNSDLKGFLATMSKTRRLLREKNPELDAFLYRWGFVDTLAHENNQFDGALDFWRHAPGMGFPLPIHTFE